MTFLHATNHSHCGAGPELGSTDLTNVGQENPTVACQPAGKLVTVTEAIATGRLRA
jgi:hypothetical protein